MFDPKSVNCTTGCSIDTTPCPNSQWGVGYPAYGLHGSTYAGYSYKTDTGFERMLKPAKDGKFYLQDQIHNITHDGSAVPMYKSMLNMASTVSELLYGVDDLNKLYDLDATGSLSTKALTFKSINDVDVALSADGQSFVWGEYTPETPIMYVVRDEETPTLTILLADKAGNPIDFNHPSYKDLLSVNDRVMIKRNDPTACDADAKDCCSDFIQRTIVAKGEAEFNGKRYPTITLEGGTNQGEPEKLKFKGRNGFGGNQDLACLNNANRYMDGIYPGDEVQFTFSSFDPCNPMMGGYQVQGYTMKHSNIQYVGKELCFEWAELRVGYDNPGGISAVLGQRLSAITKSFVEQHAMSFYLGENRRRYNAAGIPASTMGLLTEIYSAHAQKPWLRLVRSAASAVTLEDKALIFMEMLMQVQQSAVNGNQNKVATVVMDNTAIYTFTMLRKAFRNLGGWMEMHTGDTFDFSRVPMIKTPFGTLEIMTCPFLQRISGNSGMCLFLDKKLIGARQPEEFVVDLSNGNGTVTKKQTAGFIINDITDPRTPECRCYQVYTKFANIFIGVDSPNGSPFGILEGFKL